MTDLHKKSLEILFASPVTDNMIKFLTDTALRVLPNSTNTRRQSYPTPPGSPSNNSNHCAGRNNHGIPSLMTFISRLVRYTNVYTSTLLTTAVYLNRLKKILPKDAAGLPSTCHRIFLACLILSAKYHNDSSPLNKHWTKYTDGMFTLRDVNLMERQLLQLMQWDLRADTPEICDVLRQFVDPIKFDLEKSAKLYKQRQLSLHQQTKKQVPIYHQRNQSTCSSTTTVYGSRSTSINSLDILKEYEDNDDSSLSSLSSTSTIDFDSLPSYTAYTQYV